MVRILKQPRWAFWRYEEAYEFDASLLPSQLIEVVVAFYGPRHVVDLGAKPTSVRFARGSVIGSLFSPLERHHQQDVIIRAMDRPGGSTVICQYLCWDPFPNLHVGPRFLYKEVQQLERFTREQVTRQQLAPHEAPCHQCGRIVAKENAIQYGTAWVCANCKVAFVQKLREGAELL